MSKNILGKLINIVMDIMIFIFGIILLISIYNAIQVKVLGNDYSSFFGYSVFEVQTGSMADYIEAGDWIVVKYSKNIELDDVVTFEQDGEFITHRVIEAYNGTFVTQGDANNSKDDPISQEQIVGKVVKILPAFGIFKKTIFNPAVLITLIITLYLVGLTFKKIDNTKKVDVIMANILKKLKIFIKNIIKLIKEKLNKPKEITKEVPQEVIKEIKEEPKDEVVVTKVNEEVEEPVVHLNQIKEEDFDKTMYFRMVQVDKDELVENKIEIPEEEVEEIVKEEKEPTLSVVETELEMINKKKKKFKNVIEKAIFIKEEEIKEIIDLLNDGEKLKTNEATIKEQLLKVYIDGKYYNYCGDVNVEYNGRNMASRVIEAIKKAGEKLNKQYKGSDKQFNEKVKKYVDLFTLITYIEQANLVLDDLQVKKQTYKNKILKTLSIPFSQKELDKIVNTIIKTQKKYKSMIKYILEKLETELFNLKYNQVNKNIYALELEHNVNFSKVYSDYIVDKTYNDGIIAEDKMVVLINLLSIQLIKDMFEAEFNKKYILYVPESLYEKDNKLDKVFKLLEDEYAKNNVIVLAQYDKLVKNKKVIKDLIKLGYKFAVDIENNEIKNKDISMIQLMTYIFMPKKRKGVLSSIDVLAAMPNENNIIYDDIASKVGSYWGE